MADDPLDIAAGHIEAGRLDQARALLTRVLQRSARDAVANNLMSSVLGRTGQFEQAVFYARRAAEARPDAAGLWFNLGHMLSTLGRHTEAMVAIRSGLERAPKDPQGHHRLALALAADRRYAEAAATCERGLRWAPTDGELVTAYADSLLMQGMPERAMGVLLEGLGHNPESLKMARWVALTRNYDPGSTPRETFESHRLCGRLLARMAAGTMAGGTPAPPAAADVGRRIRVGIMSADLRDHAVARFVEPMLRHLDRSAFEVTCYHTSIAEDAVTARLASLSDRWRHPPGSTHDRFAALIRADGIDILFELAGYTADTLINTCAFRGAPVQVTYIGYPNTTGVAGIDYRIVDSLTDPAGEPYRADDFATERLVRLDPCFLCYQPPVEQGFAPREAVARADRVTFGCFNALQKINDPLLRLWRRVVDASPGSGLLIKSQGLAREDVRRSFEGRIAGAGIDLSRVEVMGPTASHAEHLGAYWRVDIALDTFPYCGTTTTCEALWMGVPVVSLAGRTHASRVGLSLLSAAGLPELCAGTEDGYVAGAAGLAADRARLGGLRSSLRERLLGSALCDGPGYGRRLGGALREMWARACMASP